MLCVVYQLRRHGEKLPPDEVRAGPTPGYLVLDRRGGQPVQDARLYDKKGGTELMALSLVYRVKIDDGIMLQGFVERSYQKHDRQAWWVLPGLMDDLTVPP